MAGTQDRKVELSDGVTVSGHTNDIGVTTLQKNKIIDIKDKELVRVRRY